MPAIVSASRLAELNSVGERWRQIAKSGVLSFVLGVATSCSGIQNEMPHTNETQERAALAEIESYPLPPSTNAMSGDAAQQMLFNVMVDDRTTNFTDTHPAGPERLANYDMFVELVENDLDGLPGEDQIKEDQAVIKGESPAATADKDSNVDGVDPKKCRFYLPADDICIY